MLQDNSKTKKSKIILKSPTQERSRQTVATILDACSKLLVSEGFYNVTTDKIAKEAGVSIGSLYQFFGNKESVVLAVIKKIHEEDRKLVAEAYEKLKDLPIKEKVVAMINLGFSVLQHKADLRAKLLTVQYYLADVNYMAETIRYFEEMSLSYLPQFPGRDPRVVSKIFTNAFLGLMNSLAVENPNFTSDANQKKEIELMFLKYLDLA
ncbi:MAG: TetR/AcrR family transcriptional regulator [Bdellovibrionia bacterium]